MSASYDLQYIWNTLINSIIPLTEVLEGLKRILQEAKNILRFDEFSTTGIELRYDYETLSRELNDICFQVLSYVDTVKSLHEMTDDEDQIERIRSEVRRQEEEGTENFKREDTAKFPELNNFLDELLYRVGKVDDLSTKIQQLSQEYFSNVPSRIKPAEIKAGKMENAAKVRKIAFGATTVICAGFITEGIGLGLIAAAKGTLAHIHLSIACISGGVAIGYASGNMYKKYSDEEAKFIDIQDKIKLLNRDAFRLSKIMGEVEQNTQLLRINIEACFIRDHDQPILLTQIPKSLKKLLTSLQFKGVNFEDLTERIKCISEGGPGP